MAKSQSKWNNIYQKQRNNQLMRAWDKTKKEVVKTGVRLNERISGANLAESKRNSDNDYPDR